MLLHHLVDLDRNERTCLLDDKLLFWFNKKLILVPFWILFRASGIHFDGILFPGY